MKNKQLTLVVVLEDSIENIDDVMKYLREQSVLNIDNKETFKIKKTAILFWQRVEVTPSFNLKKIKLELNKKFGSIEIAHAEFSTDSSLNDQLLVGGFSSVIGSVVGYGLCQISSLVE